MAQEIESAMNFELNDAKTPRLPDQSDPTVYWTCEDADDQSQELQVLDHLGATEKKEEEIARIEVDLVRFFLQDNSDQLVPFVKAIIKCSNSVNSEETSGKYLQELKDRMVPCRLLQLACKLDSVSCANAIIEGEIGQVLQINALDENGKTPLHYAAEMHSARCIDLLLRKLARTDIRSKDGNLPLETALSSTRMQVQWTPNDTIAELLDILGDRDLRAVRMLAERTENVADIVYKKTMDAEVVALAVLLLIAGERLNDLIVQNEADSRKPILFYCVIDEIISLGRIPGGNPPSLSTSTSSGQSSPANERRKLLLLQVELLQLFRGEFGSCPDKRLTSLLIRASEAGDGTVVRLLLRSNFDVNDTDGDGNSALHWCLKTNSSSQDPSIAWLLLKHGARANLRNRLGLTPVHVAAANRNFQALQILLLRDPDCAHIASETKETPLFYAVKNDCMDCAQLLLRYGANSQALNLRRQRPIDLAKSQDMRFMLSRMNFSAWNRTIPMHDTVFWSSTEQFDADSCERHFSMNEESNIDESALNTGEAYRYCMSNITKTEICRYFESPGGCVRGDKCYYAHGEGELRPTKASSGDHKQGPPGPSTVRYLGKRVPEDLNRKIFIGGLSPSVESEDLREFFESHFGPVDDAIVIASQAGEQIQSRGFGFVTFKHEQSVASAVQVHYVTIFGKKVEIKSAVPRIMFPLPDVPRSAVPVPQEPPKQTFPTEKIFQESDEKEQFVAWVDRLLAGHLKAKQNETYKQAIKPTEVGFKTETPWVETFKKWLPEFLRDVSKRLKDGEWYPLSSLKGDFRATCGLELDHAALGYLKLSDFMRSLPGICRMKIVPVGRGPATHMVLLESLPRPHRHQPQQQPQPVMAGHVAIQMDNQPRSYADVACHEIIPRQSSSPLRARPILQAPLQRAQHSLEPEEVGFTRSLFSAPFGNVGDGRSSSGAGAGSLKFRPVKQDEPPSVDPRFLIFLQRDRSFFTPWNPPLNESEDKMVEKLTFQFQSWEKSPETTVATFSRPPSSESLVTDASDNSSSGNGRDDGSGRCLVCKERKAVWASVPCGHKLLCGACKRELSGDGKLAKQCPACQADVKTFISLCE